MSEVRSLVSRANKQWWLLKRSVSKHQKLDEDSSCDSTEDSVQNSIPDRVLAQTAVTFGQIVPQRQTPTESATASGRAMSG